MLTIDRTRTPQSDFISRAKLDGFIAEKDGSTAWLSALNSSESDAAIQSFYQGVDTIIMGRKTYEQCIKLAGTYPYQEKQSYVFF